MSNFNYGGKLPGGQHERHPFLPDAERKDFIRPVRDSYQHVGIRPTHTTRPLTEDEQKNHAGENYVCFESYPESMLPSLGRFWTQKQLASGCGTVTTMGRVLAETYAAKPTYYGKTFCTRCGDYFPVGSAGEFVWIENDDNVGPRVGT